MNERIVVFVNDTPLEIFRGMHVEHALIAYGYELYEAAREGRIVLEDENGFQVGLKGSMGPGARLYTKRREEKGLEHEQR